jgi:hypothetical protein
MLKLKVHLLLYLFFAISLNAISQRYIGLECLIKSLEIEGKAISIDTIRTTLRNKKYKRVILWENDTNKVAACFYGKIRGDRVVKCKMRVDVWENGKWRKPRIRIYRHGFRLMIDRMPCMNRIVLFDNTGRDPFEFYCSYYNNPNVKHNLSISLQADCVFKKR